MRGTRGKAHPNKTYNAQQGEVARAPVTSPRVLWHKKKGKCLKAQWRALVLPLACGGRGEERQKTWRPAFVHALWVLAPCPDLQAPWPPKHGKIHTYPLSNGENRACKRPCARLHFDKLKVPAGCIELLKQLTLRPCACYRKHQKCLRHDHTLTKLIQTTCGCRC